MNGINERNGNHALHYACQQRDEKMVKLLLTNNAVPDITNRKGQTPLDIAKRYRSVAIQQLLKSASNEQVLKQVGIEDEIDDDAYNEMANKPRIHRPTELRGVKLGTYVGGVISDEEEEESSDMADSDNDESGNLELGRVGTELSDKDSDSDEKPKTKKQKKDLQKQLSWKMYFFFFLYCYYYCYYYYYYNNNCNCFFVFFFVLYCYLICICDIYIYIYRLEIHRIKAANPFVRKKLERKQTKKILEANQQREKRTNSQLDNKFLREKRKKLPELEGWLEKRKPRPPYQWQKRWVIVKETHILWSDKQRSIQDPSNQAQRKEFNGFLNINVLQEVSKYPTKSQNKLVIKARDAKRQQTREYMWKCPSTEV